MAINFEYSAQITLEKGNAIPQRRSTRRIKRFIAPPEWQKPDHAKRRFLLRR
jgi:hypothetical protein